MIKVQQFVTWEQPFNGSGISGSLPANDFSDHFNKVNRFVSGLTREQLISVTSSVNRDSSQIVVLTTVTHSDRAESNRSW